MILALTGNRNKEQVAEVLPRFVRWLRERDVQFIVSEDFKDIEALSDCDFVAPDKVGGGSDVVLSFGGDGTFLSTVRLLRGLETPVLGINLGGLGYLTELSSEELFEKGETLLEGKWDVEKRMLLEIRVSNGKQNSGPWYALNDVVIDKAGYARLIELRSSIDGVFLNSIRGDGLIVSTPTGSTGYSLSSGGPILEPKMAGILLVPLNPHSLSNRPLVIDDDKTVEIQAFTPADHTSISVDGETVAQLKSGQKLTVKRAAASAHVVKLPGREFYEILRQKLKWGDNSANHPEGNR